jgi:WD40 repeat protein
MHARWLHFVALVGTVGLGFLLTASVVTPLPAGGRSFPPQTICGLAFSPDGKQIVSCDAAEHGIRVWDVPTKQPGYRFEGHEGSVNSAVFSPDGSELASAGDDNTVRLWSMKRRQATAVLRGHTSLATVVAFSPDGKMLASGDCRGEVRL